jgi:hypothetical protein
MLGAPVKDSSHGFTEQSGEATGEANCTHCTHCTHCTSGFPSGVSRSLRKTHGLRKAWGKRYINNECILGQAYTSCGKNAGLVTRDWIHIVYLQSKVVHHEVSFVSFCNFLMAEAGFLIYPDITHESLKRLQTSLPSEFGKVKVQVWYHWKFAQKANFQCHLLYILRSRRANMLSFDGEFRNEATPPHKNMLANTIHHRPSRAANDVWSVAAPTASSC